MPDSPLLTADEIERLGAAAGLSVADICRSAGIAHSTFTRWRNGETEPRLDVYRRLRDVVLAANAAAKRSRTRRAAPLAAAE